MNKYSELLDSITSTNIPRNFNEHVLLFDGLNCFLRSFTAINHINPSGNHVGGLTGFIKSIGYVTRITNPTRVIILFDGIGASSNRKNLYPDYKSNRHTHRMTNYTVFQNHEEEQNSIRDQLERAIQYMQCLPISMLSIDGLEADDIIAYMCSHFEQDEFCKKVTVVSADQDYLQLLTDKIKVYSPIKKHFYEEDDILKEYDISSANFLMYKVLMGDTADNIPGIKGLGPKKLIKLFPELQEDKLVSLNEIFEKSKKGDHILHERILEKKIQLEINLKLMDLRNVIISKDNIEIIRSCIDTKPNNLKQDDFVSLYSKDQFGEAFIKDPIKWMSEIFLPLESYN